MRIQVAMILAAGLFAGEAAAASILQIDGNGAQSSQSVIVISEAPASASFDVLSADVMALVSPSIIAMSEPAKVSDERVAAINAGSTPVVLRGGVAGDALPAPVAEEVQPKPMSRPEQRKKERDERRAVRESIEFGEPMPQKAETQQPADQPATAPESGS